MRALSMSTPIYFARAFVLIIGLLLCGGLGEADIYEPDNSLANATAIPVDGTPQQHSFGFSGDVDYLSFPVLAGRTYVVDTANLTAAAITDTVIAVFWPNGTLLAENDDDMRSSTTDSRLVFAAPQNGTFFAGVQNFNASVGGEYTVSVTKMGVLEALLIAPSAARNVSQNATFNYTSAVSCSDGPCGAVRAILDPEEWTAGSASGAEKRRSIDPLVLKELERNPQAAVLVLFGEDQAVPWGQRTKHAAEARERKEAALARVGTGFARTHDYTIVPAVAGRVTREGLEALGSDPAVAYVGIDTRVRATLDSSVPSMAAQQAWDLQVDGVNITGGGVTVCVIDTGVNYTHPDFGSCAPTADINDGSCPAVPGGVNYCPDDLCSGTNSNPMDNNGHGTHVAATVAGNHSTYRGVAPGAKIVAMKALDSTGSGYMSDVIAAIDWCTANAAQLNISVISMSLGADLHVGNCDRLAEAAAVDAARAAGILVVAASGNEFEDTLGMLGLGAPSCVTNATSVGATYDSLVYAPFSNRDIGLDVLAPGVGITAARHTGGHVAYSGTSMAAPHVAGAAALLIQQHRLLYGRSLTPLAVEQLLRASGSNATDPYTGLSRPRVNSSAAAQLKGVVPTTPGALPFWTADTNPVSCGELLEGSNCTNTWMVNASVNSSVYTFFAIYENEYSRVETARVQVTATPPLPGISLSLSANSSSVLTNGSVSFALAATVNGSLDVVLRFNSSELGFNSSTVAPLNSSDGELRWPLNLSNSSLQLETAFTALLAGNSTVRAAVEQDGSVLRAENSTVLVADPDVAPPVTLSFVASSVGSSGATLTLETDENSSCRYGVVDETYADLDGVFVALNASRHQASLSGLASSTAYTYFARCADTSGNAQPSSANASFTTDAARRSGGGGGGGAPRPSPDSLEQSFRLSSVAAGEERTLTLDRAKVPVSAVSFVAAQDVRGALVRVEMLAAEPPTRSLGRSAHSYISIEHPASLLAGRAHIDFSVPRSWLAERRAAALHVRLYRYVNEEWVELPTEVVGEDAESVGFRAVSPGFSYFAIALATEDYGQDGSGEDTQSSATDTPVQRVESERPQLAESVQGDAPVAQVASSEQVVRDEPPQRALVRLPLLLVIALAAGLFAYLALQRR